MKTNRWIALPIFAVAMAIALAATACGGGGKAAADAGLPDAAGGPPDASCFTNPTTHLEIINACTNAQYVDKHPNLPLQLPDGGLPPLPQ